MSENERKELSEKLHFGLALAERRMLEEKALRNECIIQGLPNGEIKSVPARIILRRLYGEDRHRLQPHGRTGHYAAGSGRYL